MLICATLGVYIYTKINTEMNVILSIPDRLPIPFHTTFLSDYLHILAHSHPTHLPPYLHRFQYSHPTHVNIHSFVSIPNPLRISIHPSSQSVSSYLPSHISVANQQPVSTTPLLSIDTISFVLLLSVFPRFSSRSTGPPLQ